MTYRDREDDIVALYVAAGSILGYLCSVSWERHLVHRLFYSSETALEKEISSIETEAQGIRGADDFFQQSRLRRRALELRQQLNVHQRRRSIYELTVGRFFSPITGCVPATAAHATDRSARLAPAEQHQLLSLCGPHCRLQSLLYYLKYNLPTMIQYGIRYGALVLILILYGNRQGIVDVPPSLDIGAYIFLGDTLLPMLRDVALYGPAAAWAHLDGLRVDQRLLSGPKASAAAATPTAATAAASSTVAAVIPDLRGSVSGAGISFDGALERGEPIEAIWLHGRTSCSVLTWWWCCTMCVYLFVRLWR